MKESINVCKVCDQTKREGLHLFHAFICTACEKEILNTSPEEDRYQYFVNRLKGCAYQKQ